MLDVSWPTGLWYSGTYQEPAAVALGNSGGTTYEKYYLGIWSKLISTAGAGGTGFELTYDGPGIKHLGYVSVGDATDPPAGLYFILFDPAAPNGESNGVSPGPFKIFMGRKSGVRTPSTTPSTKGTAVEAPTQRRRPPPSSTSISGCSMNSISSSTR